MAYYGPGSTGQANTFQPSPIPTAISNPPFFHTNKQLPTETGSGWGDRITREFYARGGQSLPDSWDVLNPGGPGVAGLGAFATPSPFLFPGALPPGGVRMPDGSVVTGSVGANGQITGHIAGGAGGAGAPYAGTPAGNNFSLAGSPTQGSGVIGQVNPGIPGGGGAGGSVSLGNSFASSVPSNPTQSQADAILNQQRDMAVARLHNVDDLFNSRLAELTSQGYERQMTGQSQPFSDQTLALMEARLADQATAADRGRRNLIREQFAGRGLAGSGLQRGAEQASMTEASAQRGQNLGNLLIQQAQDNFAAQERGRAGGASWLSAQAAGILPAILKEADLRSRFEVTGDAGASDVSNALTSMALSQLQGPDPASNPAAFNTQLPFGPGAVGNISTPGGPPIRATGGVVGGLNGLVTPPGQGGGLQGSNSLLASQAQSAQNATQALQGAGTFGAYGALYGTGANQAQNAQQAQNAAYTLQNTGAFGAPTAFSAQAAGQQLQNTGAFGLTPQAQQNLSMLQLQPPQQQSPFNPFQVGGYA